MRDNRRARFKPGASGFRVADLNVRSLGAQAKDEQFESSRFSKVDTILRYVDKEDGIPFVAFFQETWLDPQPLIPHQFNPSPVIPEGYATLISHNKDPDGQIQGRG